LGSWLRLRPCRRAWSRLAAANSGQRRWSLWAIGRWQPRNCTKRDGDPYQRRPRACWDGPHQRRAMRRAGRAAAAAGNLPASCSPSLPVRQPAGGFQTGQTERPSCRLRPLRESRGDPPAGKRPSEFGSCGSPPQPPKQSGGPCLRPPSGAGGCDPSPPTPTNACPAAEGGAGQDSYLVDPASSHMLVSKIKPCMCEYKQTIQ
jgi:hypothetical protein